MGAEGLGRHASPSFDLLRVRTTKRRQKVRDELELLELETPRIRDQRVRDRLRASIMLQLDVEIVPTGEIPESASSPRFVDAFVDKRGIKGSRDQEIK